MNHIAPTQNKRLASEQDSLSLSSTHTKNYNMNIQDILESLPASPTTESMEKEDPVTIEIGTNKEANKVMLVNKATLSPHNDEDLQSLSRKRSKPRRQSGDPVATMTPEAFQHSCLSLLKREDSVTLLKKNPANTIPFMEPLDESDNSNCIINNVPVQQQPLMKQQRRSKPRRMSGDAVAKETKPVLIRDDSITLTKQKQILLDGDDMMTTTRRHPGRKPVARQSSFGPPCA